MLSSSDNGAKGSDGDDYVSPDALHQTTGPREVMGMITYRLLMLSSSDNGAKGSDWNKKSECWENVHQVSPIKTH